jgi:GMP synthase - Glutamine amidotransferase domain
MLLIIQNGHITPHIFKYIDETYEIVKSFENNLNDLDLSKYTIVIILGGHQSVLRITEYPYLIGVINLIRKCMRISKPLLGICLGCQLIAHVLGCQIKSSGKLNIGYDAKILGYDQIFRCHIDYIVPNDKITVLEYFENMPYLYQHGNQVYGIQCHPDLTPESVKKYAKHLPSNTYAKNNSEIIDKKNAEILKILLTRLRSTMHK